jgi:hypothetical protein
MSTVKTINVVHPSSASNNITLDSSGATAFSGGTATFSGTSGANAIRINGAGGSWFWIDNPTTTTLRFSTGGSAGTNPMTLDDSGNLRFNSGYGSAAIAYGCRAWVNFNGTGTVAIRASGNVTSITDNGTGDYTVNFTNAMPDGNYAVFGTSGQSSAVNNMNCVGRNLDNSVQSTTAVRLYNLVTNNSATIDNPNIFVGIFR